MTLKVFCERCKFWDEIEHDPHFPVTESHSCGRPYSKRHGLQPTSVETFNEITAKKASDKLT